MQITGFSPSQSMRVSKHTKHQNLSFSSKVILNEEAGKLSSFFGEPVIGKIADALDIITGNNHPNFVEVFGIHNAQGNEVGLKITEKGRSETGSATVCQPFGIKNEIMTIIGEYHRVRGLVLEKIGRETPKDSNPQIEQRLDKYR